MAITEAFANTQSVGTTEHDLPSDTTSLGSQTDDGVYQPFLDLSALADGDTFTFRVYEKAQAGDTQREFWKQSFSNTQGAKGWPGPSFVLMNGWTMTLKKDAGTDRTITWSIRKIA